MPDRITRAEIDAKRSDYHTTLTPFRTQATIDQDFIHADDEWRSNLLAAYISGFPKGFVHKGIPIARVAIEAAKNTVMVGEIPELTVNVAVEEGKKLSDTMERRRTITEQAGRALLAKIAYHTSNNPFTELLRKQYGLGPGILAFPWDESKWPKKPASDASEETRAKYEEAMKEAWPWDVHVEHPLNIYPDPYNDPLRDYIIDDEIPQSIARERYPELALEATAGGKVKRLVYCSEDWYAVYIGGQAVFGEADDGVVENPMGMLWYELALSGVGESNETGDPVYLWQGLVRSLRGVISMIITNYNMIEAIKWKEVFGPQHLEAASEEEAEALAKKIVYEALAIFATGPGVRMSNLFQPSATQNTIWEQSELNRWIEMLAGPLTGNFQQQETTSSGLAQRVSLQTAPFQAAKVSSEQAIANMVRKMLRYYKTHIGEHFYLHHFGTLLSIKADDLLEDADFVVELRPVTAADRALSKDADMRELKEGIISLAEYRRRHAIKNGDQLDKERALETLKWYPEIVQAMAGVVVRALTPGEPAPAPNEGPAPTEPVSPVPAQNGREPALTELLGGSPIPTQQGV